MGKEMSEELKCQKASRTLGSQLQLVLSHGSVLLVKSAEGSQGASVALLGTLKSRRKSETSAFAL